MAATTNREAYLANRFLREQELYSNAIWPDFDSDPSSWQEKTGRGVSQRLYSRESWLSPDGSNVVDPLGHKAVARRNLALPCTGPRPNWREILAPSLVASTDLLSLYRDHGVTEETLRFAGLEGALEKRTDPTPYGPCLHHLWAEAQGHVGSDVKGCFRQLANWALRRPACWDRDDQHRALDLSPEEADRMSTLEPKQRFQYLWYSPGGAFAWIDPLLGPFLNRPSSWQDTNDLNVPWKTVCKGQEWSVRINDFPDEYMYSLIVDGEVIGDFLRWPPDWERPGDAEKPKPKKPKIKPIDLLPRYLDGQHKEVWTELIRLGPQVRSTELIENSRAVARETMRRAHYNLSLLIPRLQQLGYEFLEGGGSGMGPWSPPYQGPWEPPRLVELESSLAKVLPLSLAAWLESIGYVSLAGRHPKLSPLPTGSRRPEIYADPFEVKLFPELLQASVDSWERAAGSEGTFDFAISESALSKAMIQTSEYGTLGQYKVEFPNPNADGRISGLRGRPFFVDYLRIAFKWGGFPGWADQKEPPLEEIKFLTQGMLEL